MSPGVFGWSYENKPVPELDNINITPTIATAKKLEKELNIKLVEKPKIEVAPSVSKSAKFSEPTLADMIEKKEK